MSRRKRQPEQFDVVEFLRESDGDLKSALNSLLRSPAAVSEDDAKPVPGLKLVSGHGIIPGPELISPVSLEGGPNLSSGSNESNGGINLIPGQISSDEGAGHRNLGPDIKLIPGANVSSCLAPADAPSEITPPAPQSAEPKKRRFPIREMRLAQDAHTRAEQQVYESLWQNAQTIDDVSRTITIGFGAMARMVRLSESNARINVRSLIAKLAMEEFGDYNCEKSLGRTYRIFNYSEILKRRREAGLLWYMRRTLAVVFVNPSTGQPLDLGLKKPGLSKTVPGLKLNGDEPGLNLEPARTPGDTSPASDALLFDALSQYGAADVGVVKRLRMQTRNVCRDFTDEELVHFIHSKGALIRRPDSRISSPIGFLLSSVPKCFVGEAFQLFRKAEKEARDREAAERAQREAEFENWRKEQQAILDDPNASEEDKRWARKML